MKLSLVLSGLSFVVAITAHHTDRREISGASGDECPPGSAPEPAWCASAAGTEHEEWCTRCFGAKKRELTRRDDDSSTEADSSSSGDSWFADSDEYTDSDDSGWSRRSGGDGSGPNSSGASKEDDIEIPDRREDDIEIPDRRMLARAVAKRATYGPGECCGIKTPNTTSHSACKRLKSKGKYLAVDKSAALAAHNKCRKGVAGDAKEMPNLIWDDELACVATAWAAQCNRRHDKYKQRNTNRFEYVGQNLAFEFTGKPTRDLAGMTALWCKEKKFWEKGAANGRKSSARRNSKIGHFTQVAWAHTTHVGCGAATCGRRLTVFACNYGPAGNMGYAGDNIKGCPYPDKEGVCPDNEDH